MPIIFANSCRAEKTDLVARLFWDIGRRGFELSLARPFNATKLNGSWKSFNFNSNLDLNLNPSGEFGSGRINRRRRKRGRFEDR